MDPNEVNKETEQLSLEDFIETPETSEIEKTDAGADKPAGLTFNVSRFKEVDEEIDSEDKLYDRYKATREENENLRLLAKGKDVIEKDQDIASWKGWLSKSDEELYLAEEMNRYLRAGKTKEEALEKANNNLKEAKEKNPRAIEEVSLNVRGGLNEAIAERSTALSQQIAESSKSIDLRSIDAKVVEQAQQMLVNPGEFLGLKYNETTAKQAEQAISSGKLAKALRDPAFLIKAALLLEQEKGYTAAIAARTNGKAKLLDKLPKQAPFSTKKVTPTPVTKTSGTKAFDPSRFAKG